MKQISISHRPKLWSEVIGQDVNVRILKNSILMNRVPNALLLSGIRGVGKTTIARLYAKSLNCKNFTQHEEPCCECESCINIDNVNGLSVMELDAASNNGIDDIRKLEDILNNVIDDQYRVVILDECHMLSKSAQSALLKILEEPVKNVVFMLVTTNPENLNDTIRSRCLSVPMKSITMKDIGNCVKNILLMENVKYDEEIIGVLSINSSGSLRDVQQMLEQLLLLSNGNKITLDMINEMVGVVSITQYQELAEMFVERDLIGAFEQIKYWYKCGIDMKFLFGVAIPNILRDFSIYLSGSYSDDICYISGIKHESFEKYIDFDLNFVNFINREWEISMELMRDTDYPEVIWDLFVTKIFHHE